MTDNLENRYLSIDGQKNNGAFIVTTNYGWFQGYFLSWFVPLNFYKVRFCTIKTIETNFSLSLPVYIRFRLYTNFSTSLLIKSTHRWYASNNAISLLFNFQSVMMMMMMAMMTIWKYITTNTRTHITHQLELTEQ